jgi:hypothetical protein
VLVPGKLGALERVSLAVLRGQVCEQSGAVPEPAGVTGMLANDPGEGLDGGGGARSDGRRSLVIFSIGGR